MVAGGVATLMHGAVDTLSDIDYDNSAVDGIADGIVEPCLGRGVARAIGFKHHTFDTRSGVRAGVTYIIIMSVLRPRCTFSGCGSYTRHRAS